MSNSNKLGAHFWPITSVDVSIGHKIRGLRESRQESTKTLADHLRLSVDQVRRIENGQRHLHPAEMLKLARHYKVDALYFFEQVDGENDQYMDQPLPPSNHYYLN